MKSRLILFSLFGLLLVGALLLFLWRPGPSIRFVGFQEGQHGKLASFQIANDRDDPYSFLGDGPFSPVCSYKTQGPSGWKDLYLGEIRPNTAWFTVAPHAVTEFEVAVSPEAPSALFKVGVYLERGSAEQLMTPAYSNFISDLLTYLREKIQPGSGDLKPTWSEVAQP
ncbi:hypothetical protein [Prosthecobacter sp.]|uniref:hypothetical protein n=1 Tax=Prosthecobacter sp. TaxID=1965333 RepID=UPI003783D9F0